MNGRALSAIIMLLVLLAAGLVSVPASAGEHPWDSDVTGGEEGTVADYDWDTRAADSAQLDIEFEVADEDESGAATAAATPSVNLSLSSLILGFLSAVSIGI